MSLCSVIVNKANNKEISPLLFFYCPTPELRQTIKESARIQSYKKRQKQQRRQPIKPKPPEPDLIDLDKPNRPYTHWFIWKSMDIMNDIISDDSLVRYKYGELTLVNWINEIRHRMRIIKETYEKEQFAIVSFNSLKDLFGDIPSSNNSSFDSNNVTLEYAFAESFNAFITMEEKINMFNNIEPIPTKTPGRAPSNVSNSCFMNTIFVSMFLFSNSFINLLTNSITKNYHPCPNEKTTKKQLNLISSIQRILRDVYVNGIRTGDTKYINSCSVGLRVQLIECASSGLDIKKGGEQGDVDIFSLLIRAFGMEDVYSLWWYETIERGGNVSDVPTLVYSTLLDVYFEEIKDNVFELETKTDNDTVVIKRKIVYAPKVLAIKIADRVNFFPFKRKTKVKVIPKEELILPGTSTKYKIMAIVCHEGENIDSGHFIAFFRKQEKQGWVFYDDLRSKYDDANFSSIGTELPWTASVNKEYDGKVRKNSESWKTYISENCRLFLYERIM